MIDCFAKGMKRPDRTLFSLIQTATQLLVGITNTTPSGNVSDDTKEIVNNLIVYVLLGSFTISSC